MEMWSSLHGRVRRSVLPRVYACSLADKTSWACHTTRKASVRPLGVTCIMYVCSGKRQKEGYIRGNMQNPSGWYHGACVTEMGDGKTI